tara:strand:- start:2308 stop:4230 length:1923 start_codon:yes stop_codon:yes gene_type:complete
MDLSPSFKVQQFYGQSIGETWSYSDIFKSDMIKKIEGVAITDDQKSAVVIDNLHKINDVNAKNLHFIKLIPDQASDFINQLVNNKIEVDFLTIPKNEFFEVISKMGEAAYNIGIYIFVFTLFTGIIRSFAGNNDPMNNMISPFKQITGGNIDVVDTNNVNTTFSDVAGCDEAKFELMEVVDFLKNGDKYEEAGAKIPTGVLLEGSPGTGKTLMAKAVAGEAQVPFISVSGSEFIEMFVGVGASRVRNLFQKAKENAPCVVFIDEIDAVGRQRGAGIAGGNDEREQTLNQILTNMDGFETKDGIVVLAATNRIDILDSALTRPGRFDRKVRVPLPDSDGRKAIFNVHFKNKKIDENIDFEELATLTGGFSGADIANLANEAAIFSVRKNESVITRSTMLDAYEKCTIGLPSNVQVQNNEIVDLVSNHETGHALLASLFDDMFDVRKVTINENKNGMGGYTLFTPKERYQKYATKRFLLANLIIALGGRAAEVYLYRKNVTPNVFDKYVFDKFKDLEITTGASNDLIQANKLARDYITQYGFGDNIGIFDSNMNSDLPFMGREMGMNSKSLSENSKCNIEMQISRLVEFAFNKALELIEINEGSYQDVVNLLKKERTISGMDITNIIEKHKILNKEEINKID